MRFCNYTDLLYPLVVKYPHYYLSCLIKANRVLDIAALKKFDKTVDEHTVWPTFDAYIHSPNQENTSNKQPEVSVVIPIYNVEIHKGL